MKKITSIILSLVVTATMLASCGDSSSSTTPTTNTTSTTSTTTEAPVATETPAPEVETKEYSTEFVLDYVDYMKAEGYETLVLDEIPERIVCLSTSPVLAMHEMGADLIMVPTTTVIDYPTDWNAEVIPALKADDFDLEKIIAADPGLVLVPATSFEEFNEIFKTAGIPCYAVPFAHGDLDQYGLIKEETVLYTNAFVVDEASQAKADAVMKRFEDLDAKIESAKSELQDKVFLSTMISAGNFSVLQETSTLGSVMKRLGLTNAYTPIMGESMGFLDLENVVDIELDLMIFISATTDPEVTKQTAIEAMAVQQEVWDTVSAVVDDHVLYLTTNYWVFGGIQVIDSVDSLIDLLLEAL